MVQVPGRPPTTQSGAFARLGTPLGGDVLLLDGFEGREAISEPFRFNLRMHSESRIVDAADIVGKTLSVTFQRRNGAARHFHGIVTRFAHVGAGEYTANYTAEIAPRLWLLTLGRDRAIYQNLSAFAIIRKVLADFGVVFESEVTASRYLDREYCVQYDESPFDFISRLMEEEGIFYFFRFSEGAHTMVLADSPSAHVDSDHGPTLTMRGSPGTDPAAELMRDFEMARQLGAATQVLADYDLVKAVVSQGTAPAAGAASTAQQYLFPGKHADAGEAGRKAAVRQAAQEVEAQAGRGQGACYQLSAGCKFLLSGHINAALDVAYVLRSVTHSWAIDPSDPAASINHLGYSNVVSVFPLSVPFRAPQRTARPVVNGAHTAVVTGLDGEEIWTDTLGRIKVKFHWDRTPNADQDSSCWVRVAQALAGPGWGHLFLPRVGHEVVVSYVDGDPDRPLVTGCVYNGKMAPPVTLPGAQTQSVMRSRSSKGGSAGNELRMEDKADAEELYLRAQRDMTVSVQNKLATTVVEGGESHLVQKGDRAVAVQSGNETHDVSGTRKTAITGAETHTNGAAFTQDVTGNYKLTVSGNLTIEVSGAISIQAGSTFASKAGASLTTEAASITHKASGMQTVESGGVLTLKGAMVKLN
jgi:type VI secretion system secreted protein VgrG